MCEISPGGLSLSDKRYKQFLKNKNPKSTSFSKFSSGRRNEKKISNRYCENQCKLRRADKIMSKNKKVTVFCAENSPFSPALFSVPPQGCRSFIAARDCTFFCPTLSLLPRVLDCLPVLVQKALFCLFSLSFCFLRCTFYFVFCPGNNG